MRFDGSGLSPLCVCCSRYKELFSAKDIYGQDIPAVGCRLSLEISRGPLSTFFSDNPTMYPYYIAGINLTHEYHMLSSVTPSNKYPGIGVMLGGGVLIFYIAYMQYSILHFSG